jgi:hypothetical protein
MRRALLAVLLLAAACSRKAQQNYKHCLKLRVGMTREQMLQVMGPPEDTIPYVEGKSLAYLKGRTAYEWSNPASMPGPDHVSFSEVEGKIESIRCSNAEITASVYVEPPAPSTAAAAVSTAPAAAVPAAAVAVSTEPMDFPAALAAYRAKDLKRAFVVARPLADADQADAQLLMGLLYSDERATGPEAANEALKWFYRAGRKKNGEAAYGYAMLIEKSNTSPAKVAEEYQLASDLECPAGQLRRGQMLLDGWKDVVEKDPAEGEKLIRAAAQAGSPKAQMVLSAREEAAKNPAEALRWAQAAAKHPVVDKYQDPLHAFSADWSADDQAQAEAKVKSLGAKPKRAAK